MVVYLGPIKVSHASAASVQQSKNGIFRAPLDLGTETGDGWELSSQTECKTLVFMHNIICSCSSYHIEMGHAGIVEKVQEASLDTGMHNGA